MDLAHALRWDRDGRDWPHRECSHFVTAGGRRWLVQRMGRGPVALLIHGTGASVHSWRAVMPLLSRGFTVVAMDLPGHGFTDGAANADLSLVGMARSVHMLVQALGLDVDLIVGHSAGAAVGARMVLDGHVAPRLLVAVNGAFFPLAGVAGVLFPAVARVMAVTPWAARWFARRTWEPDAVKRLIAGTGSTLDPYGIALYGRLMRDPAHTAGALAMMAQWELRPLAHDLANWRTPLGLIVGARDRAVSPDDAERLRRLLPASTACSKVVLQDAGHLAHEERPVDVAQWIGALWAVGGASTC